jgi:uncharacterized protein YyaL (SSP411 family)
VDWREWGDEAFAEAKERGVPVFLSIGYTSCHWCHVMERESFSDPEVAAFLNERFVAIKVDREERPDVDALYMDAVHLLAGHGGWPASIWLTPDRLPFAAGTYFPPTSSHGRPGFFEILARVSASWQSDRSNLEDLTAKVKAELQRRSVFQKSGKRDWSIDTAVEGFARGWDDVHPGWGDDKKFPMTPRLEFMLSTAVRHDDQETLERVRTVLEAMRHGGIHDHLGGGFHRYTVDRAWRVPHFEKMLYDNGQLLRLYAEAAVVFDSPAYRRVVEQLVGWLEREMRAESGAFWSSQGADSEGEEGTFYVWTPEQIRAELEPEAAEQFLATYRVTETGNFDGGRTVLSRRPDTDESQESFRMAHEVLFSARAKREPPQTDQKEIVAWNGLVIGGLARAGRLLDQPRYIALAEAAAEPILEAFDKRGVLPRTLSPNAPSGVLADYAFVAEALFDLFEATGDDRWLSASRELTAQMVHRFYDAEAGGFFESPPEADDLFLRRKDLSDGSEPSASGRAATVLARFESLGVTLGHATALTDAFAIAERWFAGAPQAVPSLLDAWDRRMRNGLTVVVTSKAAEDESAAEMWSVVNASFAPHATLARVSRSSNRALAKYPLLEGKLRDRATAFVCFDGTCDAPTTDAKTLAKQLQSAVERAR